MMLRNVLLAATLLVAPVLLGAGAAKAQPVTGIYIGGGVGVTTNSDTTIKSGPSGNMSGSIGPAVVVSLGYGFGNGFRAEIEGNWRQQHETASISGGQGGDDNQIFGGMVNGLYDFNLGSFVYPYVGVGVGYEATQRENLHFYSTSGTPYTASLNSSSEGSFAAQGIVGLGVPLSPAVSLTLEYRALDMVNNESYGGSITTGGHTTATSVKFGNQLNHSILFGVRYSFGVTPVAAAAPAPAPVAAPAPAPARTYLVFFDWDKADLTDRAKQIIADAAQASTHVAVTKIMVNGYTDLSGTPAYNQVLSVKRAQAVAAELVHDGVPAGSISAQGFGQTHPLVPTAAGVREPQNRRVEIILQ